MRYAHVYMLAAIEVYATCHGQTPRRLNSPYSTFRRDGTTVVIAAASKLYSHSLLSALQKYIITLPSPIRALPQSAGAQLLETAS